MFEGFGGEGGQPAFRRHANQKFHDGRKRRVLGKEIGEARGDTRELRPNVNQTECVSVRGANAVLVVVRKKFRRGGRRGGGGGAGAGAAGAGRARGGRGRDF